MIVFMNFHNFQFRFAFTHPELAFYGWSRRSMNDDEHSLQARARHATLALNRLWSSTTFHSSSSMQGAIAYLTCGMELKIAIALVECLPINLKIFFASSLTSINFNLIALVAGCRWRFDGFYEWRNREKLEIYFHKSFSTATLTERTIERKKGKQSRWVDGIRLGGLKPRH